MRRIVVIGVGAGNPEHMTVEAVRELQAADVIFELARATTDLTLARQQLVRQFTSEGTRPRIAVVSEPSRDRGAADYAGAVADWRTRRTEAWEHAIGTELGEAECGAFLVWGDPALYDSTMAVLDDVLSRGSVQFRYEVIPGISSIQALTAGHRISLNRIARPVLITTGRLLSEQGWPDAIDDLVVMLDGRGAYREVIGEPLTIYWGAYLGTPDQMLVGGQLAEVADEIDRMRDAARERKGWIMDCYLLRRADPIS